MSRSRCTGGAPPHPGRTRTRSSSPRTSSSAARVRPACWSCAGSCCATGCRPCPGGGTVDYVNALDHHYIADPAHREEGGTPAIVESIRAGLVFQLKQAVGTDVIHAHEEQFLRRACTVWQANDRTSQILGNVDAERLSILSFVVRRPGGRYLHHNFVVAAAQRPVRDPVPGRLLLRRPVRPPPARHRPGRSHRFEQEIVAGCEGIKPGWVRVSFNYFISEATFQYIVDAVHLVATHGWLLLPEYRFDPYHRAVAAPGRPGRATAAAEPAALRRGRAAALPVAVTSGPAGVALARLPGRGPGAVRQAGRAAGDAARPRQVPGRLVSAGFEELRWFDLPEVCLSAG